MIEYHTAVRGAFFDIARIADSADDIARHARYLDDGGAWMVSIILVVSYG